MSIGKSSIARAASVKAPAQQNTEKVIIAPSFTSVLAEKIELLSEGNAGDIASLKKSIERRGILSPLLIGATASGKLWLIDGARRLAAALELGISDVPAMVVSVENKAAAARLQKEIGGTKAVTYNIHEEKFRLLEENRRDMPYYLL